MRLQTSGKGPDMEVVAGTLRTARPIMRGEVLVPRRVFELLILSRAARRAVRVEGWPQYRAHALASRSRFTEIGL